MSMFSAPKPVSDDGKFYLNVDASCLDSKNMDIIQKISYIYMPQNFLVNNSMVGLVLAAQLERLEISGEGNGFFINQLRDYLNCTDLNVMMGFIWSKFYSIEAQIGDKAVSFQDKIKSLQNSMRQFVSIIFSDVLTSKPWKSQDWVYATRSSHPELFRKREATFRNIML